MSDFVLGFVFSEDAKQVVIIHKIKPDAQRGKVNGIGGKQNTDEGLQQAMAREFLEETGVLTNPQDWKLYATLDFRYTKVYCFKLFNTSILFNVKTTTEERVQVTEVESLYNNDFPTANHVPMLVEQALNGVVNYLTYKMY